AGRGRRPPPDRGVTPERLTNSVWWTTVPVVPLTQKSPRPFSSVRSHPDGRLVELDGPRGAEEPGVAVVEDPAVGGGEPVAPGVGRRGQRDHGLVELDGPRGAEEPGGAVVEDPAVRGGQPVALAASRAGQ